MDEALKLPKPARKGTIVLLPIEKKAGWRFPDLRRTIRCPFRCSVRCLSQTFGGGGDRMWKRPEPVGGLGVECMDTPVMSQWT